MTCVEAEPLLGASLDGELDARTAFSIEEHLSTCDKCSEQYRKLELLHEELAAPGLDWSEGVDLRPLRAAIVRQTRPARSWWRPSLVAAAAAALAIALVVPGILPRKGVSLDRQIVDDHIRALMADHLVDVPSSDRHTVKPWFQGKLPFAPVTPDLSAEGFVLTGGRLDVIAGRPAAAIVYKRQNHIINVWMASAPAGEQKQTATELDGYHLLQWRKDGLDFWAASDLNLPELSKFADLIRSR
ncbi:MAG TPA: anti-sigma factor [Candidatus Acidoferrum sp.]|nr:anti-sigma factor [Candidatus Acidoferrum sp.]